MFMVTHQSFAKLPLLSGFYLELCGCHDVLLSFRPLWPFSRPALCHHMSRVSLEPPPLSWSFRWGGRQVERWASSGETSAPCIQS